MLAVLKCLPVTTLMVFVLFQGCSMALEHTYQRELFVGLLFSCVGDFFLVWPEKLFITGMCAFAIAHVFYIRAFTFQSELEPTKLIVFAVITMVGVGILYRGLTGILVPTVPVYIFILNMMTCSAFSRVKDRTGHRTLTELSACVGSILFLLSDLVIGVNKFVMPVDAADLIIMVTYYGAQMFIAMSTVGQKNADKTMHHHEE